MALSLNITITDPQTIALLRQYSHYISQVEQIEGTLDELAQGLVVGCIDEHPAFRRWCRVTREEREARAT